MLRVTKKQLERKVDEQNEFLEQFTNEHPHYRMAEHRRNYYIQKLNEMDENNLTYIEL